MKNGARDGPVVTGWPGTDAPGPSGTGRTFEQDQNEKGVIST